MLTAFFAVICTLFSTLPQLLLIPVSKKLPEAFSNSSMLPFIEIAGIVIVIYILKGVFNYLQNYLTGLVSIRISQNIRNRAYKLLLNQNFVYIEKKAYGEITKILTDDINKINEFVFSLISELIPSLIMMIFTLSYIFYVNTYLAFSVILLVPTVGLLINFFTRLIKDKSEAIQLKIIETYSKINESIFNLIIIKTFNLKESKINEFDYIQSKNTKDNLAMIKIIASQPSIIGTVQTIAICLIVTYARFEMIKNNMSISDLLAFATAMTLTIEPVIFLTKSLGILSKNYNSLISINNFLSNTYNFENNNLIKKIENFDLCVKGLNFSYDGKTKIFKNNLNFDIKYGETIIISANNGAGKSTLVKILLKLYDNYSGELKLGDKELNLYCTEIYNNYISVSFNEPFLFNTSIKENIILNKPFNETEFNEICNLTFLTDFVQKYENGYDFIVGEKGNNLSSGQKQRISIARALYIKPKILILDEATSSFDIKTEKEIYKNIRLYLPESTLIIISHKKDMENDFLVAKKYLNI